VASLYLWAISVGACGLEDYATSKAWGSKWKRE